MSFLPLEITDEIINILTQDDLSFSSTKACSLVCHEFHHLCRKHIFASIDLTSTRDTTPTDNTRVTRATTRMLQELLDISPDVAHHIRSLRYSIGSEDLNNGLLILKTFRKITRLQSFDVGYLSTPRLQWNDNPLRPALLHLLHLPTLIHFNVLLIDNFMVSDLTPCINLEQLSFVVLTVLDETPSNLPEKSIRLRNVSAGLQSDAAIMKMCAMNCADGKPFIDFSCVNDLTIRMVEPNDAEATFKLLSRCEQLTRLDVHHQVWDSTVNVSLIGLSKVLYPSMQTLRHLHVQVAFDEATGSNDPLAGLSNELKEMKNNNVVETITIQVTVQADSDCDRGDEWGRLDTALAQPGWPKLQRVSLAIIVWSYERAGGELEHVLKKLPQTQFPGLSSSKSLSFEFSVRGKRDSL